MRWWRDYESECIAWWHAFNARELDARSLFLPATAIAHTANAILAARYGSSDRSEPLCALLPPGFFRR